MGLLAGIGSLTVYSAITWLSFSFVYGQGHRQRPIFLFVALYGAACCLYWAAVRALPRHAPRRGALVFVLGAGLLFRAALLPSNPIQEDDFYRYLWDGKVVASGLNPYGVAPQAVLEPSAPTDVRLRPYAQLLRDDPRFVAILSRVNHPTVPTIYPPLAQAVFAAVAGIAPGSLLALRLAFLGCDLALCAALLGLLGALGANPLWVIVYAWSPLIIKETINSAHYDVVPTLFLVVAMLSMLKGRILVAHAALALAILGKVYPCILVPIFAWRAWQTHGKRTALRGLVVTGAAVAVGYAPSLSAGWALWDGTLAFAGRWETNSFLFPLIQALVRERWWANGVVALGLSGLLVAALRTADLRNDRAFVRAVFCLLGGLFLLSPVGNPWYFVWLAPFLCVFPLRPWLLLSGLLGLYYLSFYFLYHRVAETFRWVIWLEYVPFYVMLLWEFGVGATLCGRPEGVGQPRRAAPTFQDRQ